MMDAVCSVCSVSGGSEGAAAVNTVSRRRCFYRGDVDHGQTPTEGEIASLWTHFFTVRGSGRVLSILYPIIALQLLLLSLIFGKLSGANQNLLKSYNLSCIYFKNH